MLAYLARLTDLAARDQRQVQAGEFGLARIEALLAGLGSPQAGLGGLHIAGTHGKGSVAALSTEALRAAGYKVGTFTSPHLQGALAGIQVDGEAVALEALEASFAGMQAILATRDDWTVFEVVVALAFLHFAQVGVDLAVVEAGLGGRLDATNVWTPSVSVIAPVDYDHTEILGDSLAAIAAEKGGIIKPGVPVVLAAQPAEARAVLLARAAAQAAPLVEVGQAWGYRSGPHSLKGQRLWVWAEGAAESPLELELGLLGQHQAGNAATAYAALQTLAAARGLALPAAAVQAGFAAARWPGRFEVLQSDPPLVLDAAHSPGAVWALRQALDDYFPQQELVLVLGVSADKDLRGMLAPLQARTHMVIATQSAQARAMPTGQLATALHQAGFATWAEAEPRRAVQAALQAARPGQVVLVCGSVFLVDQVRQAYRAAKAGE